MTETTDEVRTIHWAVKLVLTVVVGGLFAIGELFISFHTSETIIPSPVILTLCVAILILLTTILATFLYRRESNGWRRSLLMGVVVGLVASTIITMAVFLFIIWLLSTITFM